MNNNFLLDLGRSLGVCVFVTNCSEQIDYKSIGNTFKGLAMRSEFLSFSSRFFKIFFILVVVGDVLMSKIYRRFFVNF